tara:strand:- start:443 stop:751 length:309 start_codon:yes stop_codon:yes gene_type:complete
MRNKPLPGLNKLGCGCMGGCKCNSPLRQIESETKVKDIPGEIKKIATEKYHEFKETKIGDLPVFPGGFSFHQLEDVGYKTKKFIRSSRYRRKVVSDVMDIFK